MGIDGLTSDLIALLKKRVYDVAAITDKNLKVKYNSNLVPIKNFQQYIDMYIGDKTENPSIIRKWNSYCERRQTCRIYFKSDNQKISGIYREKEKNKG